MLARALGVVTIVGAFVGCGVAPPDEAPEEIVDDAVGVSRNAAATCVSYSSTIRDHIAAGRAYQQDLVFFTLRFPAFYASGSAEPIGSSATQTVTLYPRTGGGYTTNASLCQAAMCGNGVLESPPENCDGAQFAPDGPAPLCTQFGAENGPWVSGTVKCTADCKYDVSDCRKAVCGDGKVEGNEECDGANLGFYKTCQENTDDGVFTGGQLKCKSDCTYDTSSCITACGNGVLDAGEDCDGTLRTAQYAGKTCSDIQAPYATWPFGIRVNYAPGALSCNSQCRIFPAATCKVPPGCYFVPIGGGQPAISVQCF